MIKLKNGQPISTILTDKMLGQHFANVEHVHNYSWYIGNYPSLQREKIDKLVSLLNKC